MDRTWNALEPWCHVRQPDPPEPGLADWAIRWPLSMGLGLVVVMQLAAWLPHYLTWPYWADHDVFATAARGWDRGVLPYRDFRLNNFPGTIYLFYLLGKVGGWGRHESLFAADAGLLLGLGVVLLAWSRRRFGRALPGWVGYLIFLSYYLSLDYCHVAQRDWHAACLSTLAMLVVQGWPGRWSRLVSAALFAMALSVRPQVVLFLPAVLLMASAGDASGRRWRPVLVWIVAFAVFTTLLFLPLMLQGLMGDFLRSLRHVTFGSKYNGVTPSKFLKHWALQLADLRWLVVPVAIGLLSRGGEARDRQATVGWLVALAGVSIYKPISPTAHSYLEIPLVLIWSVNVSLLAHWIIASPGSNAALRLGAVLGLLGLGATTLRPDYCAVGPSLHAQATLKSGVEPVEAPPGYRRGRVGSSAIYPWADYRGLLEYLKTSTTPTTRVANALKGDPALVSMVDRPSAFPAESIAWLRIVNHDDEPSFARALEAEGDTVVAWSPGEPGIDDEFKVDLLEATIRRYYRPEAEFGMIQVWRRKPERSSP